MTIDSDLLAIQDNVDDLGVRMAQIDDLLHCIAETRNDIGDALYGVANLAKSANRLAGKTAVMILRLRKSGGEPATA